MLSTMQEFLTNYSNISRTIYFQTNQIKWMSQNQNISTALCDVFSIFLTNWWIGCLPHREREKKSSQLVVCSSSLYCLDIGPIYRLLLSLWMHYAIVCKSTLHDASPKSMLLIFFASIFIFRLSFQSTQSTQQTSSFRLHARILFRLWIDKKHRTCEEFFCYYFIL